MKTTIVLLLFVLSFGISSYAVEEVTVGVMYGNDSSGLSNSEKLLLASDYKQFANQGLTNSGINDRTFDIQSILSQNMNITPPVKTFDEILNWMKQQNANPLTPFSVTRNNKLGNDIGVDLVFMLATDVKNRGSGCGKVFPIPLSATSGKSETNAFGVIVKSNPCAPSQENTILHELGHLLYAEHERVGNTDGNGSIGQPAFHNHGLQTSSGQKSIMYSVHANTPPNYRFSGSSGFEGDLYTDVKAWIQGYVWDVVVDYRNPPRPQIVCNIEPVTHCTRYLLSWAPLGDSIIDYVKVWSQRAYSTYYHLEDTEPQPEACVVWTGNFPDWMTFRFQAFGPGGSSGYCEITQYCFNHGCSTPDSEWCAYIHSEPMPLMTDFQMPDDDALQRMYLKEPTSSVSAENRTE